MYHEYRRGPDGQRRKFYCVQWPKVGQGRHRQYFKSYDEARRLRDQKFNERGKYGVAHLAFSDRQRVEYAGAVEALRPFGKTLADAVQHFVTHLKANERSITVGSLVAQLIAKKQADGMSARYIEDLQSRLPRFAEKFGGEMISTITTQQIEDWLRGLGVGATSRNNYRRVVTMLFTHAIEHGYATSNAAEKASKAKAVDSPPGILSVEQTARLLEAASPEVLPYLAIGAFCGLRRAELERLDFSDVHFDDNLVEVTAQKSKTARRRFVRIQPNLREWLLPLRKLSGPVAPLDLVKQLGAARKAAGIAEWPANALRHSFASYHLAHFKDAAALALEMGHTDQHMIFAHYRQLVKPNDAQRYFEIRPTTVENIVQMSKGAS